MQVWHMNGAGNDFMVVDARGKVLDMEAMARKLCKLSGADGFMALDTSEAADFRLHFYNSDGSRGEMCGNGARCICRFAYDLGIAGETMTVETDAGIVPGRRIDQSQYRVQLNAPSVLDLHRKGDVAYVELGNPGVPHAVAERPDLDWAQAEARKADFRALRHDPAFPKGANVTFYRWTGEAAVQALTFERGVEDFTLACGTGCGSVAAVVWKKGQLPGGRLTLENRGGRLTVDVSGEGGIVRALLLEGSAQVTEKLDISL